MATTQRRSRRRLLGVAAATRRRTSIIGGLLMFTTGIAANAQVEPDRPFRLGDLYAAVLRANPKIAGATALARAAETRVSGITRPPDPALQFGFMNYSLPNVAPMPAIGMPQLQLMQMIPLGGKLGLAGRAADAQSSAALARAEDVKWELRNQTAMAFYELYARDRGLDVARETLRILQDVERTASAMYRVGERPQADVLRAQVEIARMVEDTLRMNAMREAIIAKLNALLDRSSEAGFGVPGLPAFPDTIPSRATLDSIAFNQRAMVRAAIDDVRAAEASAVRARKEIWPDVQIGVQLAQRGGEMGTERMGSLMVGASIPVFARDRQLKMRDEADAMTQMARADLASTRAETRGAIGEAYANLRRSRNLIQLYRTTVVPQAEATAASALAAYRVGRVDFMTLLDDRMTVNKYRQELYELEADQGKAWAELEMLVGRELFDANRVVAVTTEARGGK
ncbi:MAG TPA: TolC family protein [Gemmatimonadaceae bacterium]|nr:TolC family protein [Gemmatimonadaceae bacterium]